jgi:hypothetical protein
MSRDDLQVLLEFRSDTPQPDEETTRRIFALATDAAAGERHRRPLGLVLRVGTVALAAAGVALGVLSLLPGGETSAAARAAAALNPSRNTILHTVVLTTNSDTNGADTSESWQLNSPPYDRREVMNRGSRRIEFATANGRPQAYDSLTNTISTVPADTELPRPRPPQEGAQRLLAYMRGHLAAGEVREEAVTVGGRQAIRFVSSASNAVLLVDADTFQPIEWRLVSDDGITTISRFRTYELLPATATNRALLSLSAQYPDAAVEPNLVIEGVDP